ncbi:uncharacterized protein LOC129947234 [Eupeodes corollae]|uniref:uncharacterized protein LOC129947234 n=1 Tax=Eupeodes corollae TaxID=290404 RepID=UPI002493507E|nr:uncharacterized protein LOC129947234 [Eupeodes corollae]
MPEINIDSSNWSWSLSSMMDYFEYLEVAWAYFLIFWEYSHWIAYALAFITLVPKVWRRTVNGAETELRNVKFHRCYGAERCCHPLEADDSEIVRPRKKVLRRFPPKRDLSTEDKLESSHSQTSSASASQVAALLPTQPNHVNQIAKMFEGNARKVNRVTPIITNEQSSSGLHQQSPDEAVTKKKTVNDDLKYEKMTLRNLEERYFKPSPATAAATVVAVTTAAGLGKPENIPENDENSGDLLNRPLSSSSSSPSTANIVIQRRRYPSTSPSPPPPKQLSRPNSLKASIENIFALASKGGLSPNGGGPVTSIEEILSQRRLSRPLSAYSISDLLGDSLPDESYIESFFVNLNNH